MKTKKTPMRMCCACRQSKPKTEMIRIVKDKENNVSLDLTGKANGRGAYLCNDRQCFDRAIKSKAIDRALEMNIDETIIDQLKEQYES